MIINKILRVEGFLMAFSDLRAFLIEIGIQVVLFFICWSIINKIFLIEGLLDEI